jgi:hypothetical protein
MKASGTRGASGSLWENATYGLPPTQGWNVAFYNNAMIYKSPYVSNCTNFSDSEIDNSNLAFYAGTEDKGRAGDLDSAPTGGGLLVDGSVPHANSPLRSIVCDSYTHTGLDAPGIFVTNNGYMQATSSYAFFNHAHITCINGGQANLAASTSDFGRYGLIASGKSATAIFTSTVDGAKDSGSTTFNIDAPTAASGWHGSATRPQGNMLVTVNSVTYPVLSATANGSGWTVTISRPDPSNRSSNLGLNGAISDGAAVSFFLRSMIASSGHTMEYVGSGTDYRALPENGGVPVDANQKVELDNGKIWTAVTDQNGKFTVGGNQTDDPFFEVDQRLGFVTIPEGSIAFNLLSDLTPQLGGDLDVNGKTITSTSNGHIVIDPHGSGNIQVGGTITTNTNTNLSLAPDGTGQISVNSNQIKNVANPSAAQDAATKNYVDTQVGAISTDVVSDTSPQLGGVLDTNNNNINFNDNVSAVFGSGDDLRILHDGSHSRIRDLGTGSIFIEADGPSIALRKGQSEEMLVANTDGSVDLYHDSVKKLETTADGVDITSTGALKLPVGTTAQRPSSPAQGDMRFSSTDTAAEIYDGSAWGAIGGTSYPEVGTGGTNRWAVVHSYTVDADYSIPSGSHVINSGPMTVNSGVTVTIPSGSNWTIV